MERSDQIELFPEEKKRAGVPEKQSVSRDEALQEARWKLKKAEDDLARFIDNQNYSFTGSGHTQEVLEKEVGLWKTRVQELENIGG